MAVLLTAAVYTASVDSNPHGKQTQRANSLKSRRRSGGTLRPSSRSEPSLPEPSLIKQSSPITASLAPISFKDCAPIALLNDSRGLQKAKLDVRTKLPRPFSIALPQRGTGQLVAQNLYVAGVYAPIETLIMYAILGAGTSVRAGRPRLVVDVGMNLGYFSCIALSLGFDVAAFEPQADLRALARRTMAANSRSWRGANGEKQLQASLYPCAVGALYGHVQIDDSHADAAWRGVKDGGDIPQIALSDVINQDIALLKIDTEGYEMGVLAGAEALFDRHRIEAIIIEIKLKEDRVRVQARLAARGYSCFQYHEKYFAPLPNRTDYSLLPLDVMRPCKPQGGGLEDLVFLLKAEWGGALGTTQA